MEERRNSSSTVERSARLHVMTAMTSDEQEIRALVETWRAATKAGKTEIILSLMADDVIFLVPGRPPMTKADFRAASVPLEKSGAPEIDSRSEIQEIKLLGDWAFMWTKLEVIVRSRAELKPMTRAGHTLSILTKQHGKWVLARDANLLTPVQENGQDKPVS